MMRWLFSEEIFFAIATWQWFLGLGLALGLAVLIKKFDAVKPASRYSVWATAFFTVAILPWIALWPGSAETALETVDLQTAIPQEKVMPFNSTAFANQQASDFLIAEKRSSEQISQLSPALFESQGSAPFTLAPVKDTSTTSLFSFKEYGLAFLLALWIIVAGFFGIKLLLAIRRLGQLKREANSLEGPIQVWYGQTLKRLKLNRQPKLLVHQTIGSPLVAGLFQPAILVPEPLLNELSQEELQQILLHELAHIRRYDDWVHLFQKATLAMFWFHPALHWLSKQMAWDRESACDQWAISLTGKSKQYAKSLLRVSETMLQPHAGLLTVGAVRGQKQLSHRIESLLKNKDGSGKLNTYTKAFLFVLFFSCIASMAVAGPKLVWFHEKQPEPPHEESQNTPELPPQPPVTVPPAQGSPAPIFGMAATSSQEDEKTREKERELRAELIELRREKAQLIIDLKQLERERREQARGENRHAVAEERMRLMEKIHKERERLAQELKEAAQDKVVDQERLKDIEKKNYMLLQELRVLEQKAFVESQEDMRKAEAELQRAENKELLEQDKLLELEHAIEEKKHAYQEKLISIQQQKELREVNRAEAQLWKQAKRDMEIEAIRMAEEEAAMAQEFHRSHETSIHGPAMEITDHGLAYGSASGKSRMSFNSEDFEMEIRGKVTFAEDETEITRLSNNGFFEITDKRKSRKKHQLTVTPGKDGEPIYKYKYNRAKKPFDDKAKAWLAQTLPTMLMDMGVGADLRISRALESKGIDGVYNMLSKIESDFSQETHMIALMKQADLTMDELVPLTNRISKMGSDFHKAKLLSYMAQRYKDMSNLAGTISIGMESIDSDFEKRRVLSHMLPLVEHQDMLEKVFKMTKSMASDFEKRQILSKATSLFSASDLTESGYLDVLETMASDFEFSQGVRSLSSKGELTKEQAQDLLVLSSSRISSDFELARVFNHLSEMVDVNPHFEKAIRRMGSDHTKSQVLKMYIQKGDLTQAEQKVLLNCAKTIGGEHELASILRSFRDHYTLEGGIASQFQALAKSINSQHLRRGLLDY